MGARAGGAEFAPLADRPFFRAPLYVWYLAGVFGVFSDSLLAPRLVQCLFGATTVGLVYLIGQTAFDRRVGRAAGFMAAQAEGRTLKASEVSRYYASRAFGFIVSNPHTAMSQFFHKLKLFWTAWEYGNNENIYFFAYRFSWIPHVSIGFGVLAPLGLLGLFLSLRRGSELFPLWGFVIVYMLSVVGFFVAARFRVPVLPVLMIFSGHALVWLWEQGKARRLFQVGAGLLFVIGFGTWSSIRAPAREQNEGSGSMQLALAEARSGGVEQQPEVPFYHLARARRAG